MTTRANRAWPCLLIAALPFFAGCGGSGSSGGAADPGGGGAGDSRAVLLDSISAKFDTFDGTDQDSENQQMLAFLQTKPEFVETGKSPDGAWGKFADGTALVVCNNLDGDEATRQARLPMPPRNAMSRSRDGGLPGNTNVMLGTTLGSWYETFVESYVPALFANQPYTRIQPDATVDALKNLNNVAALHIFGHGGVFDIRKPAPAVFYAWTSTLRARDGSTDARYSADLKDGSLIYFMALSYQTNAATKVKKRAETHYALCSRFVDKYWKGRFDANSLVFMNTCSSASDRSLEFEIACLNAGASYYVGWSDRMRLVEALTAATYLFDRLLGSNTTAVTATESPAQRAFNIGPVLADMHTRKRADNTTFYDQTTPPPLKRGGVPVVANLQFLTLNADFQELAPSIESLEVNEQGDELMVNGTFGSVPGSVTLQAKKITVKEWTANRITCALPRAGSNSSGNVVVLAGTQQFESNPVPLTEWNGIVTCTAQGKGSLKMVMTFNVRFRADVHDRRTAPHQTPFRLDSPYLQTLDTSGTYVLSGNYLSTDGTFSETWAGQGTIPSFVKPPDGTSPPEVTNVVVQGNFDENKRWSMAIRAIAKNGNSIRTVIRDTMGKLVSDKTAPTDAIWLNVDDLSGSPFLLTVLPDFKILAGTKTHAINAEESVTLKWGDMIPVHVPNTTSARSARL